MHPGVKIGGSVPQQYLEHAHSVGRYGGVQRRPPRVVLGVSVRAGVQQSFRSVRSRVSVIIFRLISVTRNKWERPLSSSCELLKG